MSVRGGLGICGIAALGVAGFFIACSDDDETVSGFPRPDASTVDVVQPPPPPPNFPDAPAEAPDLQSRTGFMGDAKLVGDVTEPTDGPSWRDADNALYFTVPASANPLRRLVTGGSPEVVAVDAGTFAPVGTASGGGDRMFLTERESIVTLDLGDAGDVTAFNRTAGLGNTVFGDIATTATGPSAWFVDTSRARVYRFVAPNDLSLVSELAEIADAGRTTGIATRDAGGGQLEIYVAVPGTIGVLTDFGGGALTIKNTVDTAGIPANGIAVDAAGRIYVAWAKGIDVFTPTGQTARPQDGDAMLPIRAIPTSLAFGGADRKTLFVTTASGKIYSIPVQSAGIPR